MKRVSVSGSPRESVGKKDAKKLRREGKVICVVYGGKEQKHFTIGNNDFNKLIFTPEVFIVDVDLDGTIIPTILQDVQYHPVSDDTLHADFLEIVEGKPIVVELPVVLDGKPKGVELGGVLNKKMRTIPIKGLADSIPENFVIDVSELLIGDTIQVKDLELGELKTTAPENLLVVGVMSQRNAMAEDEEDDDDEEGEGEEGAAEAAGGEEEEKSE